MEAFVYKGEAQQKRGAPNRTRPLQVVEKNELEATTLEEIGKLKLIVAKVGQLGTTDVASRGSLSGAGSRSSALRLSRSP